ncbi:MAG TPA: glycosyltransferase family A protein [Pyrinomonadaceae bacterium]|jgi:hypothetical protein
MISIVCVFNDPGVLEERLLKSLATQTAPHEIITVDNRDSRFGSASEALNWGAGKAQGDWLLFAHQDVALRSPGWLSKAESLLNEHAVEGWAGVAGRTRGGEFRGFLIDREHLFGSPFTEPLEVQTLDECVLMRRKGAADRRYFDEALKGWHAYGVEACCAAAREGERNVVLSLPTWHDSKSTNMAGLAEAHDYVWRKHGAALGRISTTMAVLPDAYDRTRSRVRQLKTRSTRKLLTLAAKLAGVRAVQVGYLGEALEALTAPMPVVDVLHRRSEQEPIEVGAFVPQPATRRRVVHHFSGLDFGELRSGSVLIAPDLAAEFCEAGGALAPPPPPARDLLVCAPLAELLKQPKLWRAARRGSADAVLVLQWDMSARPFVVFSPSLPRAPHETAD